MTEAQVWAMMGVFATFILGSLAIISTLFVRVLRAEIGGLRAEMRARFEVVESRIGGLDRDVQALVKRTFGIDRD